MASVKKILFNALEGVLGDYVVGFNPEQLQVGLWSGSIELANLEVNSAAVAKLGLPLGLRVGRIDKLVVSIPWASLGSTPVHIAIEGVRMVCSLERGPGDLAPEELAARLAARLRAQLLAADVAFRAKLDEANTAVVEPASPGRIARYVGMIVDNLEVTIRRVEISVEDGDFDFSLTIDAFDARAADEHWQPSFVRGREGADKRLRNVARLSGLCLKIDKKTVLAPLDWALKLTRKGDEAAYEVELDCAEAKYAVRSTAVSGALGWVRKLGVVTRQHELAARHPCALLGSKARPVTRENARVWWRYALDFVSKKKQEGCDKGRSVVELVKSRVAYLALLKEEFDAHVEDEDDENVDDFLEAKRRSKEMGVIELAVPLRTLMVWRQEALTTQHVEKKTEKEEKEEPGFLRRWWTRGKREEKDDGPTLADLESKFEEVEKSHEIVEAAALALISVKVSVHLDLIDDRKGEQLLASFGSSLLARSRLAGGNFDVALELSDVQLRDATGLAEAAGIERGLLVARQQNGDQSTVAWGDKRCAAAMLLSCNEQQGAIVVLVSKRETMEVEVSALSYRFAYHAPLVARLKDAFSSEVDEADAELLREAAQQTADSTRLYASEAVTEAYSRIKSEKHEYHSSKTTLSVAVRIGSPIIVLPRAWDKDVGSFQVSLGTLSVDGAMCEDQSSSWRLSLAGVRLAEMAHTKVLHEVMRPLELSASLAIKQRGPAPLTVALKFETLCLELSPTALEHVLQLAALLAAGDKEQSKVVVAPLTTTTTTTTTAVVVQEEDRGRCTVDLRLDFRRLQLDILSDDDETLYGLRFENIAAHLQVYSNADLVADANLESIRLSQQNEAVTILESSASSDAKNSAANAETSYLRLPCAAKGETTEHSLCKDEKLLAVRVNITTEATDLRLNLSRVRLRCGAATLPPLKPMLTALRKGLSAFGDNAAAPVELDEVALAPAPQTTKAMSMVATLGEVEVVLLDDGDTTVASAALRGAAVSWRSSSGKSSEAAARIVELRVSDDHSALVERQETTIEGEGLVSVDYSKQSEDTVLKCALYPLKVALVPPSIAAMIKAATALGGSVGATFGGAEEQGSSAEEEEEVAAPLVVVVLSSSTLVEVDVVGMELSLMRDARRRSREDRLSLRFAGRVTMDTKTQHQDLGTMTLAAKLRDVALTLKRDDRDEILNLLLPAEAKLDLERQLAPGGEVIDTKIESSLSHMEMRLSYRDLRTIAAILDSAFPSTATEEEVEKKPLTKRRIKAASLQLHRVSTLRLNGKALGVRLTIQDDSLGPSVPLVQVSLNGLELSCDGPTSQLEGQIGFRIGVLGYNRDCMRYEALLADGSCLLVKVKAAVDPETGKLASVGLKLQSQEVIDLVIARATLSSLMEISHRWASEKEVPVQTGSLSRAVKLDETPFVLVNKTQRRMLCRVSSSKEAWLELGSDGGEVPLGVAFVLPRSVDVSGDGFELNGLVTNTPQRLVKRVKIRGEGDVMVVWEVAFCSLTNRVVGTLQACAALYNKTNSVIEVLGSDGTSVLSAPPNKRTSLHAIMATRNATVRIRYKCPNKSHERKWSEEELPVWPPPASSSSGSGHAFTLAGRSKPRIVRSSIDASAGAHYFVVFSKRTLGGEEAELVVAAPIYFACRTPCGLLATLTAPNRKAIKMQLKPGRDSYCSAFNPHTEAVYLELRLDTMVGRLSNVSILMEKTKRDAPPIIVELKDQEKSFKVEVRFERHYSKQGLKLTISCPLWIVDTTGLDLTFASSTPSNTAKLFQRPPKKMALMDEEAGTDDRSVVEITPTMHRDFGVRSVLVASRQEHVLVRPARVGDRVYSEPHSPFYFEALPSVLTEAARVVTYDAARAGIGAWRKPEVFNVMAGSGRDALRSMGLEIKTERRASLEARYLSVTAGATSMLDVYVGVDGEKQPGPNFERCEATPPLRMILKRGQQLRVESRDLVLWRSTLKPGAVVHLPANRGAGMMYTVFLAKSSQEEDDFETCWPGVEWADGVGMADARPVSTLCSSSGQLCIGVEGGRAWSSRVVTVGDARFVATVESSKCSYDFEIRPGALSGPFAAHGRLVTVAPRLAVRNVDPLLTLLVRQRGYPKELALSAEMSAASAWYWPDKTKARWLEFGVEMNDKVLWARSGLSPDSIGGFALDAGSYEGARVVIRVEVDLNEQLEEAPHSAVVVSACLERLEEAPLFKVRNSTKKHLELYQQLPSITKGASPEEVIQELCGQAYNKESKQHLVASLDPAEEAVFGWAEALAPRKLRCEVAPGSKKQCCWVIEVDKIIREKTKQGDLEAQITVVDGSRVLEVREVGRRQLTSFDEEGEEFEVKAVPMVLTLELELAGLGLCLEEGFKDARRELAYLRLSGLSATFRKTTRRTEELQASIEKLQLDNHYEHAFWPTIIKQQQASTGTEKPPKELVSLVSVRQSHPDGSSSLRYLALRVLPLEVQVDKGTVMALSEAIRALPLELLDAGEALAKAEPPEWVATLSALPVVTNTHEEARHAALRVRGLIEALVIHPMQLTLSYEPSMTKDDKKKTETVNPSFAVGFIERLATVDNARLKLKSFAVEQAMESPSRLLKRVIRHYGYQAFSQLHVIVGSLASFGAPANLVATVGGGVREFFYAPAAGSLVGPEEFAKGVFKGTTGLGGSIVGGLSSSVAGVGSAVSSNISMLSADSSFVAEREARRRRQWHSEDRGAVEGVLAGGEAVFRGLGEGVAGIFTKPVKGAQKGGAAGFFKGAAQGLLGVVVKPTVGVIDGGTSLLQGVSQQFETRTIVVPHIRPPITFTQIKDSDEYTFTKIPKDSPSSGNK